MYQPDGDALVDGRVESLLAGGLSADKAAQIAILNSRKLQALFYEIGMARADVVQSGLLSNPTLAMSLGFPDGGGGEQIRPRPGAEHRRRVAGSRRDAG